MSRDKPEPGLELDKLIAEKVLGWFQDSMAKSPRDLWFETGEEEGSLYLNHYSTDIKAAWNLAERFRLCVVPWHDGKWTAVKEGEILIDGDWNSAKTAPHAICLAALSIVEGE